MQAIYKRIVKGNSLSIYQFIFFGLVFTVGNNKSLSNGKKGLFANIKLRNKTNL